MCVILPQKGAAVDRHLSLQALVSLVVQMMQLMPEKMPARHSQLLFSDIGMPEAELRLQRGMLLMTVRSWLLTAAAKGRFGQHGLPLVVVWLKDLVKQGTQAFANGLQCMAKRQDTVLGNAYIVGATYAEAIGECLFHQ